ncbi:PGF-pre-PGF domain-containing protein [Methanohalophilus sp. RSK]|uniref:NosD domain-containing protein n=1 Tax=Methanohalophilus sp. RSK TaxID=2485783 RepID=UPI000F43A3CD|nr:NosD domain-containing protein [Methanohalophilus sp. RSK]RNI13703.1 PGF-pre-PGF domain-containing protein [Methanohalophilus sp. RSK]
MDRSHSSRLKCLLVLIFVLSLLTIATHPAAAAIITVDDGGDQNHTAIQDAITAASAGDTIRVYPGTYNENVEVNKQLNITSTDGAAVTNVTAVSSSDSVFFVTADDVTINGFNVSGATSVYNSGIFLSSSSNNTLTNNTASSNYRGIYLDISSNNTLTGNTASSNYRGIYLDISSNNTLTGNTASNNTDDGIYIYSSNNNTLTGNTVSDNSDEGIYLSTSSNNTLTGNMVSDNTDNGIYIYSSIFLPSSSNDNTLTSNTVSNNTDNGIYLSGSSNNTLISNTMSNNTYNFGVVGDNMLEMLNDINTSNTVDSKPIYYVVNNSDITIDSSTNAGVVYCINCQNISIEDLTLSNNVNGIFLYNSTDSNITNNTVSSNYECISLDSSSNNTLTSNTMSNSSDDGIDLDYSSNNMLTSNTMLNNSDDGIDLGFSSNNNTLTSNTVSNNSDDGIDLDSSSNNTLTNNTASDNSDNGIYLKDSSNNNTLTSNTALDNGDYGIYLSDSNNNFIYNNLFNNSDNINVDGTNTGNVWNTTKTSGTSIAGGSYLGGNYWLTPTGTGFSQVNDTDVDGDAICDETYSIASGHVDYLPLIAPDTTTPASSGESSSGSRASVGQSNTPSNVASTDSAIKKVLAGDNVEYDLSGGEGPVLGISFDANSYEGNVVTNVQVLKQMPDDVEDDPSDGQPYQVVSLTVGSEGTISNENADNILIRFKVSREWINENNIDPSTIRMTRYHEDAWNDLPTNQVGEDDEFLHFTAQTTGFSVFKIIGDELVEVSEPVEEPESEPVEEETPEAPAEEDTGLPGFTAGIGIAVLGLAGFMYRRTKQ